MIPIPSSARVVNIFSSGPLRTDHRILDLKVANRMHGLGSADGFRANFGKADGSDIAGLDQFSDGSHRILDGHLGVEPCRAINVDVVNAESSQAISHKILRRHRARVITDPASVRSAQSAELHRKQGFIPAAVERSSNEHFVVPHTVKVACVQQCDAVIQCRMDRCDAFRLVGRAIHS